MKMLAEKIALGLCLQTQVYVFPSWADAEEVWAHLDPEAFLLILGMSAAMWHRVESAYVLRTGKKFDPGNVTVLMMEKHITHAYVHRHRPVSMLAKNLGQAEPTDDSTLYITRPSTGAMT